MIRQFVDRDFREWQAYVSGGPPGTPNAARIFFICRDDPDQTPRFVRHASGDVARAQRDLLAHDEKELRGLLDRAELLPLTV